MYLATQRSRSSMRVWLLVRAQLLNLHAHAAHCGKHHCTACLLLLRHQSMAYWATCFTSARVLDAWLALLPACICMHAGAVRLLQLRFQGQAIPRELAVDRQVEQQEPAAGRSGDRVVRACHLPGQHTGCQCEDAGVIHSDDIVNYH